MKIENLKVYDLYESLIASGYPMKTDVGLMRVVSDNDIERGLKLIKASNGNGAHAQWLTGVRVNFDLTCSNKMWVEAERYRFFEFVSSQSTMHRISKFDIKAQCNDYVSPIILVEVERLKQEYLASNHPEDYLRLLYNIPSGFELTARIATNYRCLLNIYIQRCQHRLPEWRQFCEYMRTNLPGFADLIAAYQGIEVDNRDKDEPLEGQVNMFDGDMIWQSKM